MSAGIVSGIPSGHRLDAAIRARVEDESSHWRNMVRSHPRRPGICSRALSVEPPKEESRAADRDTARRLAGSIAELLSELLQTRCVLWQREAELAAGVPLVLRREDQRAPGRTPGGRVAAGAEAVGGDAIALYLLDEATTELKLRCSWGLPFDRLVAPARPLQGAVADLEALLGHAVVLNDKRP